MPREERFLLFIYAADLSANQTEEPPAGGGGGARGFYLWRLDFSLGAAAHRLHPRLATREKPEKSGPRLADGHELSQANAGSVALLLLCIEPEE